MVADLYSGLTAQFNLGPAGRTRAIPLNRGIKQGCPLSPILFNAFLDELIIQLEAGQGIEVGPAQVCPVLGFADDLTLLTGGPQCEERMKEALRVSEAFFATHGMGFNAGKCRSLTLTRVCVRDTKSIYLKIETEATFRVAGEWMPVLGPGESYKYLGVKFTAEGIKSSAELRLGSGLEALGMERCLKPFQKIVLLTQVVLPRVIYSLSVDHVPVTRLREMDARVRRFVKRIGHLPDSTANQFLHNRCCDGGLGIMRLERVISSARISIYTKMRDIGDLQVTDAIREPDWVRTIRSAIRTLGVPGDSQTVTKAAASSSKKRLNVTDRNEFLQMNQGWGSDGFWDSPLSNTWLLNPKRLYSKLSWSNVLRVRSHQWQCREYSRRTGGGFDGVTCRACKRQDSVESFRHVSQECPALNNAIISRHDFLVGKLQQMLIQHGHSVEKEKYINLGGRTQKPDLLVKTGNRTQVLEVAVSWDSREKMAERYITKAVNYEELRQVLERTGEGGTCEVKPIIFGCRGALNEQSQKTMQDLGLTPGQIACLCNKALEGTLSVLGYHSLF